MTVFKGNNLQISIVEEDEWGKGVTAGYSGGKKFRTKGGSFTVDRGTIESELRSPNAELSSVRLGNKGVVATFPVDLDTQNYGLLFESLFSDRFTTQGSRIALTGKSLSASGIYQLTIDSDTTEQATWGAIAGNFYELTSIDGSGLSIYEGTVVIAEVTATEVTFMCPEQKAASVSSVTTGITIRALPSLRKGTEGLSFNAEETMVSEDGNTTVRFMSPGATVSGLALSIPQEGIIEASFSMIASNKIASADYPAFDSNLTASSAAHTGVVDHIRQEGMVIQDGSIVSDTADVRCIWMSGSLNIENGADVFYAGCSYGAAGLTTQNFRATLEYELMFQSEASFRAFEAEDDSKLFLRLKDRISQLGYLVYLPALKGTNFTINAETGTVTVNYTGAAQISDAIGNSITVGQFSDLTV